MRKGAQDIPSVSQTYIAILLGITYLPVPTSKWHGNLHDVPGGGIAFEQLDVGP